MRRTASSSDFYINSAIRFSICRPSLDDERNFRHQTFSVSTLSTPPFFIKFCADYPDYPHLFKSFDQPTDRQLCCCHGTSDLKSLVPPPLPSLNLHVIHFSFSKLSSKWEMGSWTYLPALQNRFYVNFETNWHRQFRIFFLIAQQNLLLFSLFFLCVFSDLMRCQDIHKFKYEKKLLGFISFSSLPVGDCRAPPNRARLRVYVLKINTVHDVHPYVPYT